MSAGTHVASLESVLVPIADTAPLLWVPFGVFLACVGIALIGALWFDRRD